VKLTQGSLDVISQNQRRAFWEKGADILSRLFPEVIQWKGLSYEALLSLMSQSYQWTEEQRRPSQLFAVRIAAAKLCLGSFFMDDIRHEALRKIVTEQLILHSLTDDDPIYRYLMQCKHGWSQDTFKEQLPLLSELVTTPQFKIDYQSWLQRIFFKEVQSPLSEEQQLGVLNQLSQAALEVLPSANEHTSFLLTAAQLCDGIRCFDDPLCIRWHGAIVKSAPVLTQSNILKNFSAVRLN